VVVTAKVALGLAFAGEYGWQRDELYYGVAGRHLQGGYVEFPPVTALLSALAHALFGWSLVGFRLVALLAGAGTTVLAALVARELGGGARPQVVTAVLVGFSPILLATNGLFQPVSFDQLTTMAVLLLALQLALGRGSWLLLGLAAGVGLETKYTLGIVLAILLLAFLVWRRDVLVARGLVLAVALAAIVLLPNLVWEARHAWVSVHWFFNQGPSATSETRPQYVLNLFLATHPIAAAVAVAGVVSLLRDRLVRPLGATVVGVAAAYLVLGGKSYYATPVVLFAVAAGAVAIDAWLTAPRLRWFGLAWGVTLLLVLPDSLPVLPLHTADRLGFIAARSDYQDEVGWHALAAQVGRLAPGRTLVVADNYGEAGALELFGRGLPPVASGDMTFRFWRPATQARRALLVGFSRHQAVRFCHGYAVVAHIAMPVQNQERGLPIADCTLDAPLPRVWSALVAAT
jgi:hypothetical protein